MLHFPFSSPIARMRRAESRAYSKRAVQPICTVQDAICAVQKHKVEDIIVKR